MTDDAKKLRRSLRSIGLSSAAIEAAWPAWWSDEAAYSASAAAELRFSLSRKLGIDARSFFEEDKPRFVWRDIPKFKHLTTETDQERAAIGSYGLSIIRALLAHPHSGPAIGGMSAIQLRQRILAQQPFVRLADLLGLCWATGVPVAHLRVFPVSAKRMCAMAGAVGDRFAVLLAKDSHYPASVAYFLAHEIGHAALGHLGMNLAVVDLQDPLRDATSSSDQEERAADEYALELLTGKKDPTVITNTTHYSARHLGEALLEAAPELRIEPGTLALCFGHSTGRWDKATAAMRAIYTDRRPVWLEVNRVAVQQTTWSAMPADLAHFIRIVLGAERWQ